MKKAIKKAFFFFLPVFIMLQAEEKFSVNDLIKKIKDSYNEKNYALVIDNTRKVQELYPSSLIPSEVYSLYGESLYRTGRYGEAVNVLEKAVQKNYEHDKNCYFLGASLYSLKKYDDSLLALGSVSKKSDFFYQAVLCTGNCDFEKGNKEKALKCFAFVMNNGSRYNEADYLNCLQKLLSLYDETKKYDEEEKLCSKILELRPDKNDQVCQYLEIALGDAYQKKRSYRRSYDSYMAAVKGEKSSFSVEALEKAYTVAMNYPSEIKEDPASILDNTYEDLDDSSLMAEFWTKYGINEYRNGKLEAALDYFYHALDYNSKDYSSLCALYISDIEALQKDCESKEKADYAILKADNFYRLYGIGRDDKYYPDYMSFYLRWYAIKEDWNKAASFYKSSREDSNDKYYYALSLYNKKDYKACAEILKSSGPDLYESRVLYARALIKNGHDDEAVSVYKKLSDEGLLKDKDREDYALCLLSNGKFNSSFRAVENVETENAWYIAGLALFNLKDWSTAQRYFARYDDVSSLEKSASSSFYSGYCLYKIENFRASYSQLSNYIKQYPKHRFVWNACVLMANCAHSLGMEKEASSMAFEAMNHANDMKQMEESTFLCSGIYADQKKYDEAIMILQDSASLKDDFGLRSKYRVAELYEKKGDLQSSDRIYGEIIRDFAKTATADEACYRRGELFYTAGKYDIAVLRFEDYFNRYPTGGFKSQSLYYEADCYAKLNKYEEAVITYLLLVNSNIKDSYDYSARKNLVDAYCNIGSYSEGIEACRKLMDDYPERAKKDGVDEQLAKLEKLSQGKDEQLVFLEDRYEKAKKTSTREGRNYGTELAQYMVKNPSLQKEAAAIALEILSVQKKNENLQMECSSAMKNALVLADYNRKNGNPKNSGNYYLEAANYAIMSGEDEIAQKSLYGAVEAFDAALLKVDARNTASLLSEKYPDSIYTVQAAEVLRKK